MERSPSPSPSPIVNVGERASVNPPLPPPINPPSPRRFAPTKRPQPQGNLSAPPRLSSSVASVGRGRAMTHPAWMTATPNTNTASGMMPVGNVSCRARSSAGDFDDDDDEELEEEEIDEEDDMRPRKKRRINYVMGLSKQKIDDDVREIETLIDENRKRYVKHRNSLTRLRNEFHQKEQRVVKIMKESKMKIGELNKQLECGKMFYQVFK